MMKSKLAATMAVFALLVPLSSCGISTDRAADNRENNNSTQSKQRTSDSAPQQLKVNEIVGTKWKAKDGTEYEFTTKPSPMINDGKDAQFTSGFPKVIEGEHKTTVYALYQNGAPMDGNNGSGMWYAITDYFPVDVDQYSGKWIYDASGDLFLSLLSDNSSDHYRVTATKNEMKLTVLVGNSGRDGDGTFYYPFEPLQDDAQLNNGVGILQRVK
ncbi:MAG: hypothetical protein ABF747_06290 [Bifidobacterium sp.]|uniref:Lipoprotein n=1 Tax=Bifidobacterium fermentum TaxID=3059035 RepID=A0AB39ULX5_9BIFI